MRWSSAIALGAIAAAFGPAFAAEQSPAQPFEAVTAPEIRLQPPNLESDTPAPPAPAPQPPGGAPAPGWWGELQKGLDQELDTAGAQNATAPGAAPAAGATPAASGRSAGESMARGIAATCVVVALILVCYYLANRYGRKNPLLAGSALGRILGRVHLSPKAELYFVRVKDRVLVVGVTPNEVSRVAEFDAIAFEEAQPAPAPQIARPATQQPSAFAQELHAQSAPEPTASAVSDELAALKAELDKARQYFRETSGEPGAL